jgi:hypothetical protein
MLRNTLLPTSSTRANVPLGTLRRLYQDPADLRTERDVERRLLSVVNGLISAGYTGDEFIYLVCSPHGGWVPRSPLVQWLRSIYPIAELEAMVRDVVVAAQKYQARRHSDLDREAWYVCVNWPESRQRAALRAYLGMLYIIREAGVRDRRITVSHRRLAAVAGVGSVGDASSNRTISKALAVLDRLGAIERHTSEDENPLHASTVYTVVPATRWLANDRESLSGSVRSEEPNDTISRSTTRADDRYGVAWFPTLDSLMHAVWDERGLGMSACRVWHVLSMEDRPLGASEIGKPLTLTPKGVRDVIKRLLNVGMVEQYGSTWTAVLADLDDVATELLVADRPEQRLQAHRRQRQNFQTYMLNPANAAKATRIEGRVQQRAAIARRGREGDRSIVRATVTRPRGYAVAASVGSGAGKKNVPVLLDKDEINRCIIARRAEVKAAADSSERPAGAAPSASEADRVSEPPTLLAPLSALQRPIAQGGERHERRERLDSQDQGTSERPVGESEPHELGAS